MNIAILSTSTRIQNNTQRVGLYLNQFFKNQYSGHEIQLIDLLAYPMPVFDELLARNENPPKALAILSQKLQAADAIVFVSPEYNGSYSPGLKNLVDFLGKAEFHKKPIAVCSVSTGAMGGIRGALQMQELILALFGYPIPQMLLVPQVAQKFAENGTLLQLDFESKVHQWAAEFLWFAEAITHKKNAHVLV